MEEMTSNLPQSIMNNVFMNIEDDAKVAGGGTIQLYKARFGTKEICGRRCKIPPEYIKTTSFLLLHLKTRFPDT